MIVTIKTINGDEVVGRVKDEGVDYIVLDKPRVFQVLQDDKGQIRAGLVPWFLSDPDVEVMLSKNHILAQAESTSQLETAYIQQTSDIDLSAVGNGKLMM